MALIPVVALTPTPTPPRGVWLVEAAAAAELAVGVSCPDAQHDRVGVPRRAPRGPRTQNWSAWNWR